MSNLLRRSLLQAVAALVLMTGAGASDLFASTTHDVGAVTAGTAPKIVRATLEKRVLLNGMMQWVQVAVNADPNANPPYNGLGYFGVPVYRETEVRSGYYQYSHGTTLINLVPGMQYRVVKYTRTGTSPNYTYTWLGEDIWIQP